MKNYKAQKQINNKIIKIYSQVVASSLSNIKILTKKMKNK